MCQNVKKTTQNKKKPLFATLFGRAVKNIIISSTTSTEMSRLCMCDVDLSLPRI